MCKLYKSFQLHREKLTDDRPMNLVDAATRGASGASSIVANITANIIAYIAFVNLFNYVCSFFFGLIGHDYITFEWLMGKMLIPLAFLMGVEWDDCEKVGQLVGLKVRKITLFRWSLTPFNRHFVSDRGGRLSCLPQAISLHCPEAAVWSLDHNRYLRPLRLFPPVRVGRRPRRPLLHVSRAQERLCEGHLEGMDWRRHRLPPHRMHRGDTYHGLMSQ
jgi:hypothetical protein